MSQAHRFLPRFPDSESAISPVYSLIPTIFLVFLGLSNNCFHHPIDIQTITSRPPGKRLSRLSQSLAHTPCNPPKAYPRILQQLQRHLLRLQCPWLVSTASRSTYHIMQTTAISFPESQHELNSSGQMGLDY